MSLDNCIIDLIYYQHNKSSPKQLAFVKPNMWWINVFHVAFGCPFQMLNLFLEIAKIKLRFCFWLIYLNIQYQMFVNRTNGSSSWKTKCKIDSKFKFFIYILRYSFFNRNENFKIRAFVWLLFLILISINKIPFVLSKLFILINWLLMLELFLFVKYLYFPL